MEFWGWLLLFPLAFSPPYNSLVVTFGKLMYGLKSVQFHLLQHLLDRSSVCCSSVFIYYISTSATCSPCFHQHMSDDYQIKPKIILFVQLWFVWMFFFSFVSIFFSFFGRCGGGGSITCKKVSPFISVPWNYLLGSALDESLLCFFLLCSFSLHFPVSLPDSWQRPCCISQTESNAITVSARGATYPLSGRRSGI